MARKFILAFTLLALSWVGMHKSVAEISSKFMLKHNWQLQASVKVTEKGEELSKVGFQASGWYPACLLYTSDAADE